MSHFSEINTSLKNSSILKKALRKLGFEIVEATEGVKVRGFFKETQSAEFKVLTSTHYDIGFIKNDKGAYDIVGDWDLLPKVSKIEKETFLKDVKREYAHCAILEIAELKGYDVSTVEDEETHNIEMVVTQW